MIQILSTALHFQNHQGRLLIHSSQIFHYATRSRDCTSFWGHPTTYGNSCSLRWQFAVVFWSRYNLDSPWVYADRIKAVCRGWVILIIKRLSNPEIEFIWSDFLCYITINMRHIIFVVHFAVCFDRVIICILATWRSHLLNQKEQYI